MQAANRVVRSALNRAATPIVARARALAPEPGSSGDPYATGETRRAIAKRLRRQRQGSSRPWLVQLLARRTTKDGLMASDPPDYHPMRSGCGHRGLAAAAEARAL